MNILCDSVIDCCLVQLFVLQLCDEYILNSSKVNIRIKGTVIGQTNNNRPPNFRSRSAVGTVIPNLFIGWYVVKAAFKT